MPKALPHIYFWTMPGPNYNALLGKLLSAPRLGSTTDAANRLRTGSWQWVPIPVEQFPAHLREQWLSVRKELSPVWTVGNGRNKTEAEAQALLDRVDAVIRAVEDLCEPGEPGREDA